MINSRLTSDLWTRQGNVSIDLLELCVNVKNIVLATKVISKLRPQPLQSVSHSLRQPFANCCISLCSVLACSSIPLKKLSILLYCMPDITPTRATVLAVAEQLMRRLSAPPLPAPPPYSSVIPEAAAQSFQAAKCRVCSNKICVDAVSRRVCKCSFCHEAMVCWMS